MVPVIILQINHLSTEEKKISNAFINMQSRDFEMILRYVK